MTDEAVDQLAEAGVPAAAPKVVTIIGWKRVERVGSCECMVPPFLHFLSSEYLSSG
jgi:hypothetical protein